MDSEYNKIVDKIDRELEDQINKYAYDHSDNAEEFNRVRKIYRQGMIDVTMHAGEQIKGYKHLRSESHEDEKPEMTFVFNEDIFNMFRDKYNQAVATDQQTFEFQNQTVSTRYAKYVIEFIKHKEGYE